MATSELYTLSLHDALPISISGGATSTIQINTFYDLGSPVAGSAFSRQLSACRSEEHTSELQSHSDLVCRLLLEKKKSPRCCDQPAHGFVSALLQRPPRPPR